MNQRVTGPELDALTAALRHWRDKLMAREPYPTLPLFGATLTYRHKAIVASAAMGLPDLCLEYSKPPHERDYP